MSSNKIHIAIPNNTAMLCDPTLNLGTLRVGYIEGTRHDVQSNIKLPDTRYGRQLQETQITKFIKFGKFYKESIPFNETIPIESFHEAEGTFTISKLLIQFPYDWSMVYNGVPQTITKIALHRFRKWNFSPTLLASIFDRIPSHPFYEKLKKGKKDFLKRTGDMEAYKRLRSTWLVNRPNEELPYKVYELWYGRGALIIPESLGDFKGRELGGKGEA